MNAIDLLTQMFVLGKSFFVLDVQSYDLHVFATIEQQRPSYSFNIMGGSFPDTMRIVSDPDEGALIESFEYRTFGNLLFTVICDD